MKRTFRFLCIMVFALACLTVSACSGNSVGKPDPKYAGTWDAVRAEFVGEEKDIDEILSKGFTLILNEDGTAAINQSGEDSNAKWGVKNGAVKVKGDDIDADFRIEGDQLTTSILGLKFYFEKQ